MRLRGREVLEVKPATAAHRAGIRRGMHITKLNDHDVAEGEGKRLLTGIATEKHAKSGAVQMQFECPPDVRLFDRQVVYASVVKYLGVLYQENHKFTEHVQARLKEFKRRRGVLQYLSGTTWGCRRATLRQVYQGYVRAYVEYASPAWWPYINMELIRKLEVQQNHAARTISGCVPRTRIAVLLTEAGLRPLELRADAAALIARERYRRLPEGVPARAAAKTMRMSTRADELYTKACLDKGPREPLPKAGLVPSWNCDCNVDFYSTTTTPVRRDDAVQLKRQVMEQTLKTRGSFDVEIWSDGSAEAGVRNGGAGGMIFFNNCDRAPTSFKLPTGHNTCSYLCEMHAIKRALDLLHGTELPRKARVLLATDSKSAIDKLATGPEAQDTALGLDIWRRLQQLFDLRTEHRLVLQHVCSHCDDDADA
eukprot:gene8064-biopygen23298